MLFLNACVGPLRNGWECTAVTVDERTGLSGMWNEVTYILCTCTFVNLMQGLWLEYDMSTNVAFGRRILGVFCLIL